VARKKTIDILMVKNGGKASGQLKSRPVCIRQDMDKNAMGKEYYGLKTTLNNNEENQKSIIGFDIHHMR